MQCLQLADPKTLFYVFDSLSNLDCGQWYKFWIWQSHPMSAPTYCDPQTWQSRR
jgi:hypothetical protein